MDEVLSERHRAARQQCAERQRAAQAPPPPVIPSPALTEKSKRALIRVYLRLVENASMFLVARFYQLSGADLRGIHFTAKEVFPVILSAAKNLRAWEETSLHVDSSLRSE